MTSIGSRSRGFLFAEWALPKSHPPLHSSRRQEQGMVYGISEGCCQPGSPAAFYPELSVWAGVCLCLCLLLAHLPKPETNCHRDQHSWEVESHMDPTLRAPLLLQLKTQHSPFFSQTGQEDKGLGPGSAKIVCEAAFSNQPSTPFLPLTHSKNSIWQSSH